MGGFSEETIQWLYDNYSEQFSDNLWDFVACQRPNGTVYGTAGTCRKGSQVEQQRKESLAHLENSLSVLKKKRESMSDPSAKERITRLITKLESDHKAISGPTVKEPKLSNIRRQSREAPRGPQWNDSGNRHPNGLKTPKKPTNEDFGFHGTNLGNFPPGEAMARWKTVSKEIQSLGPLPLHAQRMLDSSWGRHLADALHSTKVSGLSNKTRTILGGWGEKSFMSEWEKAKDDSNW